MLTAIIGGERNPRTLAQFARGTMRGKIRQLEEALDCSFLTAEHATVLAMMLATIDYYTALTGELTTKIQALCQPYEHQITQLDAVPGTGVTTAQDIIAEIGTDMTVFPTAAHLVSWAKWCPQVAQSGGKRKGANASGRGNRYVGQPSAKPPSAPAAPSPSPARNTAAWSSGCPKKALVATGTRC